MPATSMAKCNAAVALQTAIACFAPTIAANSRSKASTCGPLVKKSECKTATTAAMSSSSKPWRPYGRKFINAVLLCRFTELDHHAVARDQIAEILLVKFLEIL
jgi:hypothetical protein